MPNYHSTHQRLDPRHVARVEREARLVVQGELAVGDRAPQVGVHHETRAVRTGELVAVDLPAGTAALGFVHRDVGAAQRASRCRAPVDRDADAGPDRHLDAVQLDGRTDGPGSAARRARGHRLVVDAAEAGRRTRRRRAGPRRPPARGRRRRAVRDDDEQLVARVVAERVVDVLEAVQVEEDDGQSALAGEHRLGPLARGPAVVQPRELVPSRCPEHRPAVLHVADHGQRRA